MQRATNLGGEKPKCRVRTRPLNLRARSAVHEAASRSQAREPVVAEGCSLPSHAHLQTLAAHPNSDGSEGGAYRGPYDPLFLFACSLDWSATADPGAGWELAGALRSTERDSRLIAAGLLADTENVRILRSEVRGMHLINPTPTTEVFHRIRFQEKTMNSPYGLPVSENCLSCKLRKSPWFCALSLAGLKELSHGSHLATYPGGALLFVEGQTPRGAFILCSGKVKLSTTSRNGKVLILRMAEAGTVLGLSAVITGEAYELTAETSMPCQVNFVERDTLLRLLESNSEAGLHATQTLSREFQAAYRDIHELVLARSSAGKLARLLLSWTPGRERPELPEVRIRSNATHEEMAQMIGSSRETVTRLLSDLKKRDLIRLDGATLVIRNRGALEELAS